MRSTAERQAPDPDPYPSRTGGRPGTSPRQDPVLWGDPDPGGPLDAEQLRAYERDGFLVLPPRLGPAEVADLVREGDRLRTEPVLRGRDEVIAEPGDQAVRSIFAIHRLSPLFARLAADPRIVDIARAIVGGDVYVHQSRLNYKPAFDGAAFHWHSDFETWHVEDGMPRMRALTVVLALAENTAFNGPLLVIPGSHHHYVACAGHTPAEHYRASLRRQEYGVPDTASLTRLVEAGGIVPLTGAVGSVVVFDCNLMHGSAGNISPWPRSNAFVVFNAVDNPVRRPYSGRPARPEFIASRATLDRGGNPDRA